MQLQETLDNIEQKLKQLVERYKATLQENHRLKTQLVTQSQELQALHAEVEQLRTQVQITRMVKINTLNLDEAARKEIRNLLNNYIREIELCIAELQL